MPRIDSEMAADESVWLLSPQTAATRIGLMYGRLNVPRLLQHAALAGGNDRRQVVVGEALGLRRDLGRRGCLQCTGEISPKLRGRDHAGWVVCGCCDRVRLV